MIQQETDNYNSENMDFFFLILISLLRQVQEDRCIYRAKKKAALERKQRIFFEYLEIKITKVKTIQKWDFHAGPVAKTLVFPMQGSWVPSLVRELDST